jgi:hypothetical protein
MLLIAAQPRCNKPVTSSIVIQPGTAHMLDAAQLREMAARTLALAMQAKDERLLEQLCVRAGDYLDQAGLLEAAKPLAIDAEKKN